MPRLYTLLISQIQDRFCCTQAPRSPGAQHANILDCKHDYILRVSTDRGTARGTGTGTDTDTATGTDTGQYVSMFFGMSE